MASDPHACDRCGAPLVHCPYCESTACSACDPSHIANCHTRAMRRPRNSREFASYRCRVFDETVRAWCLDRLDRLVADVPRHPVVSDQIIDRFEGMVESALHWYWNATKVRPCRYCLGDGCMKCCGSGFELKEPTQ